MVCESRDVNLASDRNKLYVADGTSYFQRLPGRIRQSEASVSGKEYPLSPAWNSEHFRNDGVLVASLYSTSASYKLESVRDTIR